MGSEDSRDHRDDAHLPGRAGWRLSAPVRRIAVRFAEVVCPPEVRAEQRADRVVGEFELMLAGVPPAARHALSAALIVFDRAARLNPRARGRRFIRLEDQVADQYVRALLVRGGGLSSVVRRLKGLVVMCYYELPEVKEEIGYRPGPYIAAVSRRRLARYGAQIRAGEAAALAGGPPDQAGAAGPRPGEGR